jgi:hypothetical protein
MSNEVPAIAREPRRLASILDAFPPGATPSLDDLELAMSRDTECRILAALDLVLARFAAPALPTLSTPEPPGPIPLQ